MRREARDYHSAAGWWLMTHERIGNRLIGVGAGVLLAADVAYAATHWHGRFPHAYESSVVELVVLILVALALGLRGPIGSNRLRARWAQRGRNAVVVVAIWVFVGLGFRQHSFAGQMLGILLMLALMFVGLTVREYVRTRPS